MSEDTCLVISAQYIVHKTGLILCSPQRIFHLLGNLLFIFPPNFLKLICLKKINFSLFPVLYPSVNKLSHILSLCKSDELIKETEPLIFGGNCPGMDQYVKCLHIKKKIQVLILDLGHFLLC